MKRMLVRKKLYAREKKLEKKDCKKILLARQRLFVRKNCFLEKKWL